ncbi:hypothetical protein PCASD_03325 [Puccinia coronata f. sp. avenae]|uniref:Uncharacterized protein n=1 Tax=Puccinia coronata f. sp. avenae TaxID=200324 RepID=A0A2N5T9L4_9BASI|nr:hypothetical protein PCASD_18817 [Puccinia coronata f. sp. avenae]PLW48237.1 hypothetical protein PCASD_03325 [Puccinia coronata f. sp. avenae]
MLCFEDILEQGSAAQPRLSLVQPEKQAAANNQSKRDSTSYTNPVKQAAKDDPTPLSSKPSSNVFFDEDFLQKMMMFHQLTQQMAQPSPQSTPAEPDYSAKLHKWLTLVPKLLADRSNYQSWVIMIQQALEGTLGCRLQITLPNIVLTNTKDLLLCTALLATVTESLKIRVAGEASGWDGLQLISNTFTLRSRLAHLALMRDLLETKFNHLDKTADIYEHYAKLENIVKNLYRCMDGSNTPVKNIDLVRLAHNKLMLFCQRGCGNNDKRANNNNNGAAKSNTTKTLNKWCGLCRMNNHSTSELTRPTAPLGTPNPPNRNANTQANNNHRAATAPPQANFQANSTEAEVEQHDKKPIISDMPVIQSISTSATNNQLIAKDLEFIAKHGRKHFGFDLCASHTLTNDLSLLIDPVKLSSPIPLNVATDGSKSFVTTVGKMILIKNKTGSITINNVYYSPSALYTLISAESL